MSSRKTIIFDFDGTLANSFPIVLRIANDLATTYGYTQLRKDEIEILREKSAKDVFRTLKISWWKLPFLVGTFKSELHKRIGLLKPIKNIPIVLKELHNANYRLAIITSNSEENVMGFLEKYQLEALFEYLHCGGGVFGKGKFLNEFITIKNLDKNDCVYVGDEVRDIDTAREAGIRVISVEWGYNSKKVLSKHNPDVLIQEADDLLKVMRFVFG